jgi:hypothetical protein
MHGRIRAALVCAAMLWTGAAQAADTVPFSLPGIAFKFPLPAGYCVPTGRYADQAAHAAAADETNRTDVSYYICSDMAANSATSGWGMLKTPNALVDKSGGSRAALIDYFSKLVKPADLAKMNAESARIASKGLHDVGEKGSVSLDLRPLDTDAIAAYMGGTVTIGSGKLVACAYATTVVKDRVFLIYLFRPYTDARDITQLLAQVRVTTAAFVRANGG